MSENISVIIRIPAEVKKQGEALAKEDERSFNSWVAILIKKAVKEQSNGLL